MQYAKTPDVTAPDEAWQHCERLIRRFEKDWLAGHEPRIDDYLPESDELRVDTLRELVHVDLEFGIKAGRAPRVEQYVDRHPHVFADQERLVELIVAEYVLRSAFEPELDVGEYSRRFPQLPLGMLESVTAERPGARHGTRSQTDTSQGVARTRPADSVKDTADELADRSADDSVDHSADNAAGDDDRSFPEVPGYQLLSELGRGGTGIVFLARQLRLNRLVAVKMLLSGKNAPPDERARFRREAESFAQLQHPNVLQVYEVGEHQGQAYCVLEYAAGGSLRQYLAGRPHSWSVAIEVMREVASALSYIHRAGILHRDVKPANVLLVPRRPLDRRTVECGETVDAAANPTESRGIPVGDYVLKISDFGLARGLVDDAELTATGAIIGTPAYMAPESVSGGARPPTPTLDVYSLGVMLYELLTGQTPIRGETVLETLANIRTDEPMPPRKRVADIPRDVESVCLKCLAKEPRRRFQSAEELADEFARIQAGQPVLSRPPHLGERVVMWSRRRPDIAALTLAMTLLIVVGLSVVIWQWRATVRTLRDKIASEQRRRELQVDLLLSSTPEMAALVATELSLPDDDLGDLLRRRLGDPSLSSGARLRLALALAPSDHAQIEAVRTQLWKLEPAEFAMTCTAMRRWRDNVPQEEWKPLLDDAVERMNSKLSSRTDRCRAAIVIASLEPGSGRYRSSVGDIVDEMLDMNPIQAATWTSFLESMGSPVFDEILAGFRDERRSEDQRTVAATLLSQLAHDDSKLLVQSALTATPRQYRALLPTLRARGDTLSPLLRDELAVIPQGDFEARDRQIRRQAVAVVTLFHLGHADSLWTSLRESPTPDLRSWLIHLIPIMGVDAEDLARQLVTETDVSVRRALVLACGDYDADELPLFVRKKISAILLDWFAKDPDPGIHSATKWALGRWRMSQDVADIESDRKGAPIERDRRWVLSPHGITMNIQRGPVTFVMGTSAAELGQADGGSTHKRTIGRSFAISAQEITIEQYQHFESNFVDRWQRATDTSYPAAGITFIRAVSFCRRLSELENIPEEEMCYPPLSEIRSGFRHYPDYLRRKGYRLPTEAEWEYCCRAGSVTRFSHGDSIVLCERYANYQVTEPKLRNGAFLRPNQLGFFDMHGNLDEWCQESIGYPPNSGAAPSDVEIMDTEVTGSPGTWQAIRGGTCSKSAEMCISGRCGRFPAQASFGNIGFRIARTVD